MVSNEETIRSPSSKDINWKLFSIERVGENVLGDVSLVRSESGAVLGTYYLELRPGRNEFKVTYNSRVNKKTVQSIVPLSINYAP